MDAIPPKSERPKITKGFDHVLQKGGNSKSKKIDIKKIRAHDKKQIMKLTKSEIADLYLNIRYSEVMLKEIHIPTYVHGQKFSHSVPDNTMNGTTGGQLGKRSVDPLMLSDAEQILKNNPPSPLDCKASRHLADYLSNHSHNGRTFSKSWVNTYLKHHIKK